MRRVAVIALSLGVLAASFAAAAAAAGTVPSLHVVALRPRVAVRGAGFAPRDTVTVRLIGVGAVTGRAKAAADGSFRIALARPAPLACGGFIVRATGAHGGVAFVRIGPPECNPHGAAPANPY